MKIHRLVSRAALLASLLLTGCTGSFDRKWRNASAAQATADPFDGRWEGVWRSQKHRNAGGRLQCVMTAAGPAAYQADFRAEWMIFVSSYSTMFEAKRSKRQLVFSGKENLGPLFGGIYTFSGTASPQRFSASYDSSYDTGTFEMAKVADTPSQAAR